MQKYTSITPKTNFKFFNAFADANENVLHQWMQKMVVNESGEPDKEKLMMRKRILELEMECEVLKKAALIFGSDG